MKRAEGQGTQLFKIAGYGRTLQREAMQLIEWRQCPFGVYTRLFRGHLPKGYPKGIFERIYVQLVPHSFGIGTR